MEHLQTAVAINIPVIFLSFLAGKPLATSDEFRKDPRLTRTLKSNHKTNTPTLDEELKSTEMKW